MRYTLCLLAMLVLAGCSPPASVPAPAPAPASPALHPVDASFFEDVPPAPVPNVPARLPAASFEQSVLAEVDPVPATRVPAGRVPAPPVAADSNDDVIPSPHRSPQLDTPASPVTTVREGVEADVPADFIGLLVYVQPNCSWCDLAVADIEARGIVVGKGSVGGATFPRHGTRVVSVLLNRTAQFNARGVNTTPTFVFFNNGREVIKSDGTSTRIVGYGQQPGELSRILNRIPRANRTATEASPAVLPYQSAQSDGQSMTCPCGPNCPCMTSGVCTCGPNCPCMSGGVCPGQVTVNSQNMYGNQYGAASAGTCICYEGETCPCGPGCTCIRIPRPQGYGGANWPTNTGSYPYAMNFGSSYGGYQSSFSAPNCSRPSSYSAPAYPYQSYAPPVSYMNYGGGYGGSYGGGGGRTICGPNGCVSF